MRLLFAAIVLLSSSVLNAQCINNQCPVPQVVETSLIDQQIQARVEAAQSEGPSSNNAVRITAGNGCGSGSVVGDGLIMTNAHVVGTRVGRQVTVRPKATNRDIRGTVIMAAYSDRTLADWAVVRCETGLETIKPVPMSTNKPTGTHYTTGSPRCVWPLRSTPVITADIADNSPLWRWRPNAIGGQSGSGVWSVLDNLQYGLLTWSWGGLGAGQQTSEIYRQARERSIDNAPARIGGLKELIAPTPVPDGEPVIVECGFFQQAGIDELPIWDDGTIKPPVYPEPCDLNESEQKVVAAMRNADKTNYDALVQIVLGVFSLAN